MSDHLDRVEAFLDAHRPDSARHVSADVLATLPNPDGRGWRHLTGEDLRALLADAKQLRPEYGIRAEWITGLSSEGSVAETLGDALEALDKFDARHGDRAVSRELVVRPVGTWRRLDAEQQPEDGDRG